MCSSLRDLRVSAESRVPRWEACFVLIQVLFCSFISILLLNWSCNWSLGRARWTRREGWEWATRNPRQAGSCWETGQWYMGPDFIQVLTVKNAIHSYNTFSPHLLQYLVVSIIYMQYGDRWTKWSSVNWTSLGFWSLKNNVLWDIVTLFKSADQTIEIVGCSSCDLIMLLLSRLMITMLMIWTVFFSSFTKLLLQNLYCTFNVTL